MVDATEEKLSLKQYFCWLLSEKVFSDFQDKGSATKLSLPHVLELPFGGIGGAAIISCLEKVTHLTCHNPIIYTDTITFYTLFSHSRWPTCMKTSKKKKRQRLKKKFFYSKLEKLTKINWISKKQILIVLIWFFFFLNMSKILYFQNYFKLLVIGRVGRKIHPGQNTILFTYITICK